MHLTGYKVVYGNEIFHSCSITSGKSCLKYEIGKETKAPSIKYKDKIIIKPIFLFDTFFNALKFLGTGGGSCNILECKYIKYNIEIPKYILGEFGEYWVDTFWINKNNIPANIWMNIVPNGTIFAKSIVPLRKRFIN